MIAPGFDQDLFTTVDGLFGQTIDVAAVAAAEADGMSEALWWSVSDLGFPLVGIDETRGGSGGTIVDALAVAVLAGRHAVPLPIVESHLAACMLVGSGLSVHAVPMTVAPGTARDVVVVDGPTAHGEVHDVAWAPRAERVVVVADDGVLLSLDPASCDVEPGLDLAGQPRSVVRFESAETLRAGDGVTPRALFLRGALLRAGQLAGAMDGVAETTTAYCGQREQFGRPLNAFQAVQQHLVTLAQSAELSAMSVLRAALAARDRPASFEICCAKLVANQCAAESVRAAHQAHGAISMTQEYGVQLLTRRLNAWRWEFGTEPDLAHDIGSAVARSGAFHATIAAERDSVEVAW